MFYEAVERAATVVAANYATDFAAIVTAKSLGSQGLTATVTCYKRVSAAVFGLGRALPGVGIYCRPATTNAKTQGARQSQVGLVLDFLCRESTMEKAFLTAEIAAEALMLTVDRLAEQSGLIGAGEVPFGVTAEMDAAPVDEKMTSYDGRVRLLIPVDTWESGL